MRGVFLVSFDCGLGMPTAASRAWPCSRGGSVEVITYLQASKLVLLSVPVDTARGRCRHEAAAHL